MINTREFPIKFLVVFQLDIYSSLHDFLKKKHPFIINIDFKMMKQRPICSAA